MPQLFNNNLDFQPLSSNKIEDDLGILSKTNRKESFNPIEDDLGILDTKERPVNSKIEDDLGILPKENKPDDSLRNLLAEDARQTIPPNLNNIETIGRGLATGIGSVIKAGGGLVDLLSQGSPVDKASKDIATLNNEQSKDNSLIATGKNIEEKFKPLPADSPLVFEISAAFGSSLPMIIPGVGVAGAAMKAGASVQKAATIASAFGATLESGLEAGGVANELKAKGRSQEDINKRAAATFATNLPLLFVTDKLGGLFDLQKSKNIILKVGKTAFFEGVQEGGQEAISNVATDQPIGENVAKATALGGLVGGSVGGIMDLASNIESRSQREKVFQKFDQDVKTGVIGFFDENGNRLDIMGKERQVFDTLVAEAERKASPEIMTPQAKETVDATAKPSDNEVMTPQAKAIVDAEQHGKVVGIDAETKLPIIDTRQAASQPASSAVQPPEGVATPLETSGQVGQLNQKGTTNKESKRQETSKEMLGSEPVKQDAAPASSLIEEAKKFKTAEDFVKSLEYHGTSEENYPNILKDGKFKVGRGQAGVSTTNDFDEAKEYGGKVISVLVRKDAEMAGIAGKDFLSGTGSFNPEDLIILPEGTTSEDLKTIWNEANKPPTQEVNKNTTTHPFEIKALDKNSKININEVRDYYKSNIQGIHKDVLGREIDFKDTHFNHLVKFVEDGKFSTKRARMLPFMRELIQNPDEIRGAEYFSTKYKDGQVYIKEFMIPESKTKLLLAMEFDGKRFQPITSFEDITRTQLEKLNKGRLIYSKNAGINQSVVSESPASVVEGSDARNFPQQDVRLRGTSKPNENISPNIPAVKGVNLITLKGSPRQYEVIEELPKQDGDLTNERYFKVKDVKTGEEQTVESRDINTPKKKSPVTLIKTIKNYGGIDLQKAIKEGLTYLDFKQFGLLSVLKRGGNGVGDLASQLISDNILQNPDNINPSDLLMQTLKYNRDILTKQAEALETDYDKEYAEWEANNKKEPAYAEIQESDIAGIEADIKKEISSQEDQGLDWTENPEPPAVVNKADTANEVQPESNVTPSGQVRPEMLPPEMKSLFQEEGELFKGNKGVEKSSPSGNASVGTFTTTLPASTATIELKPIETIEMLRIARELMGNTPFVKKFKSSLGMFYGRGQGEIGLNRELFVQGNEQQLAASLAHEIGHLVDYLPEGTLKRGNLLGRLLTLRSFLKNVFDGDLSTGQIGLNISNKTIKEEMKALSFEWRPFNEQEASPAFKAYRNSSKEIYADFISALLNNPGYVESKAPNAYKIFFDNLDKKLDVKDEYFAIQEILSGKPEDVVKERQKDIRRMFVKGEELRKKIDEEAKIRKSSSYQNLRQMLDDKYFPITDKINKLEGKGIVPKNPTAHFLQEHDLWQNEAHILTSDIDNQVVKPLQNKGITLTDLYEYLFLKRIAGKDLDFEGAINFLGEQGEILADDIDEAQIKELLKKYSDRENIANPLGFDSATAKRQLEFLKGSFSPEQYSTLEKSAQKFHDLIFNVVEEAVKVGSYNKNTFEKIIKPNKDYYVTFGVLNYLQKSVPAGIKMQKGTLSEIESPFITTLLKTISLIRLNSRQRAVSSFVDTWKTSFPDEIKESKKKIIGGQPAGFIDPKDGGSVRYLVDGKVVSYDVDKYVAESFESTPHAMVELASMTNKVLLNKYFKALVITYNPGFQVFNVQRDFKRAYISLNALGHKITVVRLLQEYVKSIPPAIRRQRGIDDALIREMVENKALDVPFVDYNPDARDDGYARIMNQYKVAGVQPSPKTAREKIIKVASSVLEAIKFVGSVTETMPKIAGYNYLKAKVKDDAQRAWITRNYVGTPNFRTKGTITSVTNEILIFSNIMKEGLKADLRLATNPKTRGGRWWADFKVNMFPKLLMFAAASGLAGALLKDFFDKVPEYDKTNYIILPLGVDEDGRARYLRIAHDETSRLFSAILWKVMNAPQNRDKVLSGVFSIGAGNIPSVAPVLGLGTGWLSYLSGQNPYDTFRGRQVISDTEWKAKGWPVLNKMVQWSFNEAGFSQFTTYDDRRDSTFEAVLKGTPFISATTRLIKTSDYGLKEQAMKVKEDYDRQGANEILERRKIFDKHFKNMSLEDIRKISEQGMSFNKENKSKLKEIAIELYGDKPSSDDMQKTKKAFLKYALREENNPYVSAILSSNDNESKVEILRQAKDAMSTNDYNALTNKLIRSKVISPKVKHEAGKDKK